MLIIVDLQEQDDFLGDMSASSDWLLVTSNESDFPNGYKCDSGWLDIFQGIASDVLGVTEGNFHCNPIFSKKNFRKSLDLARAQKRTPICVTDLFRREVTSLQLFPSYHHH